MARRPRNATSPTSVATATVTTMAISTANG